MQRVNPMDARDAMAPRDAAADPAIEPALESLGLSEKERKFYLAALRTGPASVTEVASRCGIGRTNGYDLLIALSHRGLLRTVPGSSGQLVVAEDPGALLLHWEERKAMIEALVPRLRALREDVVERHPFQQYLGIKDVMRRLALPVPWEAGPSFAQVGADHVHAVLQDFLVRLGHARHGTTVLVDEAGRKFLEPRMHPGTVFVHSASGSPGVSVIVTGAIVWQLATSNQCSLIVARNEPLSRYFVDAFTRASAKPPVQETAVGRTGTNVTLLSDKRHG